MKIQKLRLYASQLPSLYKFYQQTLGFKEVLLTNNVLHIQAGKTELIFEKHPTGFIYHFAFLIPHEGIASAIDYLKERGIDVLLYKGEEVIDFGTGKAIYFHDPAGNIVEFIDRPDLQFLKEGKFSMDHILRVNEIGMPVDDPLSVSHELRNAYKIEIIQPEILGDNFCWIGDYEGVFIVVKRERHWLPTTIPSVINDFELEFVEGENSYSFRFEKGQIL